MRLKIMMKPLLKCWLICSSIKLEIEWMSLFLGKKAGNVDNCHWECTWRLSGRRTGTSLMRSFGSLGSSLRGIKKNWGKRDGMLGLFRLLSMLYGIWGVSAFFLSITRTKPSEINIFLITKWPSRKNPVSKSKKIIFKTSPAMKQSSNQLTPKVSSE